MHVNVHDRKNTYRENDTVSAAAGTVSNDDGAVDQPFWDALKDDRLAIQRCPSCSTWHWPPQWRCAACGSWELGWDEVPMRGTVHAVTRTHHPFSAEMVGRTPYATVLVELPDAGGARLLGMMVGDDSAVKTGDAVVGEIDHAEHASGLPALRWRLAEDKA